jgi:hypothetical protein
MDIRNGRFQQVELGWRLLCAWLVAANSKRAQHDDNEEPFPGKRHISSSGQNLSLEPIQEDVESGESVVIP